MVKKRLLRPMWFPSRSVKGFPEHADFLYIVMCQPELRAKFESRIDYEKWSERADVNVIPLKMTQNHML
jgi:hypothetical protein